MQAVASVCIASGVAVGTHNLFHTTLLTYLVVIVLSLALHALWGRVSTVWR